MRKTLTILLLVLSLTIIAQVPQGVGYQGVATDANGIELVNQSISIRASVLSGSATGTIEWEETHSTSTDTFGLFTLTIGQGTNTTNGSQTSFADISWGTNTHFLKIEMDVTGGSNYSFMGTNQMMSVPYALYAENANINYDSISNLLSNDSTFITTVGGGIGGGGCDFQFPDGLDGEVINYSFTNEGDFTVPAGKTLYMMKAQSWNGGVTTPVTTYITSYPNHSNLIFKEGTVLIANNSGGPYFMGLLVDNSNSQVTPILHSLYVQGDFVVPQGKILYMYLSDWWDGDITVNGGSIFKVGYPGENGLIFKTGVVIKPTSNNTNQSQSFNGYLVDENYFAACGGGGSSNSSSSTQSIFTGISTPHGIIEINVDTTYNFIVPENIFLLHIEAAGGNGGGGGGWSYGTCSGSYPGGGGGGGYGASFKGLLTCSQGDTITFIVGSSGVSGNNATGWCSSGPTNGQSGSETKIMFGNEDIITLYEGSGGGAGNCYCAGYNGNVPTTGASGNNGSYSLGNLFNNSGLIIFETGTIGGGFIRIRY